jgi:polysaccharide biosynthesis protein PelA
MSPPTYICHYGRPPLAQLAGVDWALLEAGHWSAEEMGWLRRQGTRPLAYLSLSEERCTAEARPWHLRDGHGERLTNPLWGTWLVDVGSAVWQSYLLTSVIPALRERGFTGLLLDGLDQPAQQPALRSLIQTIYQQYPDLVLVVNRGFGLLPALHPCLGGVLFESFTTFYDKGHGRYAIWSAEGVFWTAWQAHLLRTRYPQLPVLALDYADPADEVLPALAIGRARAHGLASFVTDWTVGVGG